MEDNKLNPQPQDIPEDMPALDLDSMFTDAPPTEDIPLEPLFAEEPAPKPVDTPPAEPSVEEPSPEETPVQEPFGAVTLEDAAPPEELVPQDIPSRDFTEFDIPMDTTQTEMPAEAAPAESFVLADIDVPTPGFEEIPDAITDEFTSVFSPDAAIYPQEEDAYGTGEPSGSFTAEDLMGAAYGGADGFSPAYEEQPMETAFDDEDPFSDLTESGPSEPEEPAEEVPVDPPVRKGRPRRKKGDGLLGIPHLLACLVWLAIIVAIGISLGRMLWVCAADVLAFGRESKEVVVIINNDDTIDEIADKLYEKGLINYPGLFKLYAGIAVDDGEIAPGTYTLNTILDYHALVGSMSSSSSSRAVVEDVLIPEGYNCHQIFELLEENGICTVAALEEYAANGEFQDFWFLEGVERGDKYCLEGFLFPDTYDFYANSTPREAIGKMLLGFNARIDQEEVTTALVTLNQRLSAMMAANGCSEDYIAEHQMDLYDLLIVASLIEEETAGDDESPSIASVIYNRLTQNEVYERYLGIDAAIIYATGDAENIDTGIDSPYNTYLNAGLTPTPISNPGLSSITAALDFLDTDYYYYVLNPQTGSHQFSKTYEEHQEWIEKFRAAAAEGGEG